MKKGDKRPLALRAVGALTKLWQRYQKPHCQTSNPCYIPKQKLSLFGSPCCCLGSGTCHLSLGLSKQPASLLFCSQTRMTLHLVTVTLSPSWQPSTCRLQKDPTSSLKERPWLLSPLSCVIQAVMVLLYCTPEKCYSSAQLLQSVGRPLIRQVSPAKVLH